MSECAHIGLCFNSFHAVEILNTDTVIQIKPVTMSFFETKGVKPRVGQCEMILVRR